MKNYVTPSVRRWVLIFSTFGLAFLSGHLMQSSRGEAPERPLVAKAINVPASPAIAVALSDPPVMRDRILDTRATRKGSCRPDLQLTRTPDAAIHVTLTAPCHASTPISVRVNELAATDATDARGHYDIRLPFIADRVTVSLGFKDHVLTQTISNDDLPEQQHVILAWHGPETFRIRADMVGADDQSANEVVTGNFVRVGQKGGAAFEIFSLPVDTSFSAGVVRLSVDATVTEANCGAPVSTVAYQSGYLGGLRPTEIAYTMPDCDRVGEVVSLQNLFRDMRLAAR